MKKVKILIDNGHGVETPGKRSPDAMYQMSYSPLYFREYEWTRRIAQACQSVLMFRGYDAELLVPEDRDVSLSERVARVNSWCNKLGNYNVILVSIHNDASGNGYNWMKARGWSIFTTKGISEADKLAQYIWEEARKEFKYPLTVRSYSSSNYGHDYEEDFYILKKTYCPAVLVENFFQDNKEDVLYLKSDKGMGSCVHVITLGIENYINSIK